MAFRGQREHLEHKTRLLEDKLREAEEKLQAERKENRQQRWKKLGQAFQGAMFAVFFVVAVVAVLWGSLFGVGAAFNWAQRYAHSQEQARIAAHQEQLRRMKENVPEGVDARIWRWCVDHCARYQKGANGHPFSEGVVVGTFMDFRTSPPTEMISISGPWITEGGGTLMTYVVGEETRDPPAARYAVGDLVRITVYQSRHSTDYVFRVIHPPE